MPFSMRRDLMERVIEMVVKMEVTASFKDPLLFVFRSWRRMDIRSCESEILRLDSESSASESRTRTDLIFEFRLPC